MMLYEWYEAQRALMSPFSEFASASSKLYNHPLSPFAHMPMAHRVSAGLELMHRLAKDYEKPEFDIRSVRIFLMRSRMPASSSSHIVRSAGVESTCATTAAPWVGGFE